MELRAKGHRERLGEAVAGLGVPRAILAARRLRRPGWLTVLNYHRVNQPESVAELDTGVLDATPEAFDSQMKLLRRHYSPVSLDDVLAHLDGRPLPANPVLVTFDDGYRDNLEIATPILRRHGIAATFFIATGYIGGRRLFWWDRLSWALKHARRRRFTVQAHQPVEIDLDAGVAAAERRLQNVIKEVPGLDLEGLLRSLVRAAEAPWNEATESELVERHLMSWDQVRCLRQAGMHVGSHTRTHRVLQTVPLAELASELTGAREDLEAELREPVPAIAYPVGKPIATIPAIRAAVVSAGYRIGFSYATGVQPLPWLDPFDVNRLDVDRGNSEGFMLARMTIPRLFP